jgi:hypothetical protein
MAAASMAEDGGDRQTVSSDVPEGPLGSSAAPPRVVTVGGAATRTRAAASSPRVPRSLASRPFAAQGGAPPIAATKPTPARSTAGVGLGRRGVALVALLAGGAGALLSAGAHAGGVAFTGRIAAGCDELFECQSLEAEAERRAAECVFFCGREEAEHRAARLMRYRAEERRAVRDHYRERERAEQLEQERAQARARDERERRESARAQEAAREQRERLELEQLRQASLDRRLADERERRVGYYAALGPEGRARRLQRCLDRHERCDALAIDLLGAARDEDERRELAQRNERVQPPAQSVSRETTSEPALPAGGDATHVAGSAERQGRSQTVPHADGQGDAPGDRQRAPASRAPSDSVRPALPSS